MECCRRNIFGSVGVKGKIGTSKGIKILKSSVLFQKDSFLIYKSMKGKYRVTFIVYTKQIEW